MPRPPRPLSRRDGPLARFALDLRSLHLQAGPDAPSVEQLSAAADIHRSTVYAALAGKRVPSIQVLTVMVLAWRGDLQHWLARRTELRKTLAIAQRGAAMTPSTVESKWSLRDFGIDLGSLRIRRDMTLDEFSARTGLSRRTLIEMEQGRIDPSLTALRAILDVARPKDRQAWALRWLGAGPDPAAESDS